MELRSFLFIIKLILTIINIITLSRSKSCLEVSDAILSQDVVPLKQLLDVTVVYTITIIVRQNLCKISVKLISRSLLIVESTNLTLFFFAYTVKHLPQWHLISISIHSDVTKTCHTISSECWDTLVCLIENLNNKVPITS